VLHDAPKLEPADIRRHVREHGVNLLWLTAAFFNTVVDADIDCLGVRQLLTGGDQVLAPPCGGAAAALPALRLGNCYGPRNAASSRPARYWRRTSRTTTGPCPSAAPSAIAGSTCSTPTGCPRRSASRASCTSAAAASAQAT
jgi:hypothetical protein